jgi:hypothetical protein
MNIGSGQVAVNAPSSVEMSGMDSQDHDGPRKRLRVGHVSERGGVNAVRTLLERHGLVVDEVDGRSDYGRDLIVDITENNEITGAVIGVQVKGNRRFVQDGSWELPATPKDLRYWAESSVPVVGVVWNPDNGELRWVNLTAHARGDRTPSTFPRDGWLSRARTRADLVLLPETQVLNDGTLSELLSQMREYLRQNSATAFLGLVDADDNACCRAIHDCWTLGRRDARALLLLRYVLPSLRGMSLRYAIVTLGHLTPHPDILWHAENWVPEEVQHQVQTSFRWSVSEVCDLVCAVEHLDEGGGWERGGLGQSLWMLLSRDPKLKVTAPKAIPVALSRGDLMGALRLLLIHQFLADDSQTAVNDALGQNPGL